MSHIQNEMENREMHDKYRGVQRVESMIDEEIEREDEFSSFNQRDKREERDKKVQNKGTDGYFQVIAYD